MARKSSILILVLATLLFAAVPLHAATYTVDDDGPADFGSIQAAINFAGPNDTVYVFRGVYHEEVIMKDRVNLFGSGPHVTTIDGQGIYEQVVSYSGLHGAIVSGFKITGSSDTPGDSGINCMEGPLIIRNNIIEGNRNGIYVREARAKPTIINNTIVGNLNGIIFGVRTEAPPLVNIAYIYKEDVAAAENFSSFLRENRFSVDLIGLREVTRTNFSNYGLIIIGSDTGSFSDWGDPESVAAISKSGKPILGLGNGGYAFFGKLGLATGYGHGWHGSDNSIYVVNPSHPIFNEPRRIPILKDRILRLYRATAHVGINLPRVPRTVVVLGREVNDREHYPLTFELGRYLFWGFDAAPDSMTEVGAALFINVVSYLLPSVPAPPKTHTIMNNIIANNTQAGIFYYLFAAYDSEILYNDVWGNAYRNYHDNNTGTTFVPQPGTGEISEDPVFADSDYRLDESSPCKDTGHPGPQYDDPDGTRNDMGAYGGPEASGIGGFGGSGFIITDIGDIPTAEIIQDTDDQRHGLADVNNAEAALLKVGPYNDAPFGGNLWIHGIFGNADPVAYYQILVGKWVGNDEPELGECVPLSDPLAKVKYFIDDANGALTHKYISLGPKSIGGIDDLYELTRGDMKKEIIDSKVFWTCWSQADLRMRWNTRSWENGKYIIRYKAYNYLPSELSLGSNDLDHVTLIVDNSPVDANIHSVKYDSGQVIQECGIIELGSDTENLKFTITASHPSGYLRDYALHALYGRNKNLGQVVKDHYVGVHDTPDPLWYGVTEETFNSADAQPVQLKPWKTCAYQFRLFVRARTTDGRTGHIYWKEFNDHYYLDVGSCAWCRGADVNRSGEVNWFDFAILASEWLQSCGPECQQ